MTEPLVEFLPLPATAQQVIVRGRRVPLLEAYQAPGGKVVVVFDGRFGLTLEAGNYETVIDFVATVMENVMNPDVGRTFNRVVGIGAIQTEDAAMPDDPRDADASDEKGERHG